MVDFNPDANPETTSVDGRVGRVGVAESWATIHDSTGNLAEDSITGAGTNVTVIRKDTGSNWNSMVRGIFLFDTSTIGPGAVIISAQLKLYVVSTEFTIARSVRVVSSSPSSNTSLATGDYTTLGTAALATDVLISTLTLNAYNTWELNATGRAAINTTGITKLGVRIDSDADNSEPSASNTDAAAMEIQYADSTNKPTLTVSFTKGGSFLLNFI